MATENNTQATYVCDPNKIIYQPMTPTRWGTKRTGYVVTAPLTMLTEFLVSGGTIKAVDIATDKPITVKIEAVHFVRTSFDKSAKTVTHFGYARVEPEAPTATKVSANNLDALLTDPAIKQRLLAMLLGDQSSAETSSAPTAPTSAKPVGRPKDDMNVWSAFVAKCNDERVCPSCGNKGPQVTHNAATTTLGFTTKVCTSCKSASSADIKKGIRAQLKAN
jgi:hypothetical protein